MSECLIRTGGTKRIAMSRLMIGVLERAGQVKSVRTRAWMPAERRRCREKMRALTAKSGASRVKVRPQNRGASTSSPASVLLLVVE